jgi:gluconolactonase
LDLITCQHGERAVTLIKENGTRSFIATHYKNKTLNAPHDLVWSPEGNLYFTDSTIGLRSKTTPHIFGRKIPFNGIYMIPAAFITESIRAGIPTNYMKLLENKMENPTGLAFSPDYSKLYVSNANVKKPYWKVFDVSDDGSLINGKVFFNGTQLLKEECLLQNITSLKACDFDKIGAPNGLKVDIYGNVFASGPGGVLVFSPEALLIGKFRLDRKVTNLVFGADGRLYITATDLVVRVWIKTKPARIINSSTKK